MVTFICSPQNLHNHNSVIGSPKAKDLPKNQLTPSSYKVFQLISLYIVTLVTFDCGFEIIMIYSIDDRINDTTICVLGCVNFHNDHLANILLFTAGTDYCSKTGITGSIQHSKSYHGKNDKTYVTTILLLVVMGDTIPKISIPPIRYFQKQVSIPVSPVLRYQYHHVIYKNNKNHFFKALHNILRTSNKKLKFLIYC